MQEVDVPYIPDEWNGLLARYGTDRRKVTGTTILGRYLSKMKLKQYRDWRWKDTEYLQELDHKRVREALEANGATMQEIDQALRERTFAIPEGELAEPETPVNISTPGPQAYETFTFEEPAESADDLGLSDDDVTYLKLK